MLWSLPLRLWRGEEAVASEEEPPREPMEPSRGGGKGEGVRVPRLEEPRRPAFSFSPLMASPLKADGGMPRMDPGRPVERGAGSSSVPLLCPLVLFRRRREGESSESDPEFAAPSSASLESLLSSLLSWCVLGMDAAGRPACEDEAPAATLLRRELEEDDEATAAAATEKGALESPFPACVGSDSEDEAAFAPDAELSNASS